MDAIISVALGTAIGVAVYTMMGGELHAIAILICICSAALGVFVAACLTRAER